MDVSQVNPAVGTPALKEAALRVPGGSAVVNLTVSTPSATVSGLASPLLGGAIGCDFRSAQNRLLFVEFAGNLSRLDLFPTASLITSGTTILKSSFGFNLDAGVEALPGAGNAGMDIAWNQVLPLGMYPLNGARLINLGVTDFNALSAASLQGLPYGTHDIPGPGGTVPDQLVAGDVFAVQTKSGNLAKVKVVAVNGFNMTIQWATFAVASGYAVLGTGYNQPEDVKASGDGIHVYVTERSGDLVRVALGTPNRADAVVVSGGMTAPQQLFLDEANNAAYTVEFAPAGRLLRIDLTSGAQTVVLSGLVNAVGLTLSADLQFAYISEQTSGPDGGRVSRFQLSNGQRLALATGLTAPFFLTWADAARTTLYVTERDPINTLVAINAITGAHNDVAAGLGFRPSSVAVVSPGSLLVCCDQVIDRVALAGGVLLPGGPLLQGIGYIPFDWITAAGGLADTSGHPTYFFHVDHAPFGGSLPVMINYVQAALDGASLYRVFVDGLPRTDVFHGAKWNGSQFVDATQAPHAVGGQPGFYPVLSVADLALWMPPVPGCYLDSTTLTSGQMHTINVNFYDGAGTLLAALTPGPLTILVDNRPCTTSITEAQIGGVSATNDCGFLAYNPATKATDTVSVAFTATQPGNHATYSFQVIKGVATVSSASGPVSPPPAPFSDAVGDLLGTCAIAGFAASVYAAATANSGWGRQGQYDASSAVAFVLAPS